MDRSAKMSLTPRVGTELALIAVTAGGIALLPPGFLWTVPFGHLVGYAAAVILGQSLVRDLARVWIERGQKGGRRRRMACLCAESTIGAGLVVAALGLSLIGITQPVTVGRSTLATAAGVLLVIGFLAKDFVIVVRREKDHGSIVVWGK